MLVFSPAQIKGLEICAMPGCVREVDAEYDAGGGERLGYCEHHAAEVDAMTGDEQRAKLYTDLRYCMQFQPWRP